MSPLDDLKTAIKSRLGELDCVIGWEQGYDQLHATPLFIRSEADLDRLVIGPLAVHNLATYLPGLRGKKVGIIVKGCDSRSVIQLLNENLITRDDLVVFGLCCSGVVSHRKIRAALPVDPGFVEAVDLSTDTLSITASGQTTILHMADIAADKCQICQYPNALIADVLVGSPQESKVLTTLACQEEFEAQSEAEKFAFWQETMSRCIRCYACRNACPMCVCRDFCISTSRDPLWLGQENTPGENMMFQLIHVSHLTGRCTECGECERACPVDIPLLLLRRYMNKQVQDVFEHRAGTALEQTPPLLTFKVEEEGIKERGW